MKKRSLILQIGLIAGLLAIITLIMLSSIFAKFTTEQDDLSSTSRIAKGGVQFGPNEETENKMFKATYTSGSGPSEHTIVQSANLDLVLAPGTSGSVSLADIFSLSGTAETNVDVILGGIDVDDKCSDNWYIQPEDTQLWYCPLHFTFTYGDNVVNFDGIDYIGSGRGYHEHNWEYAFFQTLSNWFSDFYGRTYPANTDMAVVQSEFLDNVIISGEWPLDRANPLYSQYDTLLVRHGNECAAAGDPLTFTLDLNVQVSQSQDEPTETS